MMNIQTITYITFAILLSIYSIDYLNSKSFIFAPLGAELLLIIYEIFQICATKLDYFKNPSNWVDMSKIVLFITYFIQIQLSVHDNKNLLGILLFITLFRGISYFRLFDDTRYYINLLFEVIKDVVPFLIILFYSQIGFSLIFISLDRSEDNLFSDYIQWTYPINLNGADKSYFDYADWLNFFIVSLLNSIVMFSLVVSILTDTYGRVNDHLVVADSQALASMIYESELLFFWNRKKNQTSFIYICSAQPDEYSEKVDVSVKIQQLKSLTGSLGKKINNNRRLMKNLKRKFVESSIKLESSLEEIT